MGARYSTYTVCPDVIEVFTEGIQTLLQLLTYWYTVQSAVAVSNRINVYNHDEVHAFLEAIYPSLANNAISLPLKAGGGFVLISFCDFAQSYT